MTIQLPDGVQAINPNPESDGIQLPFMAPVFWWGNGDKRMASVGGVQYFGGWNCNDEDAEAAIAEFGALPSGFTTEARQGNDGEYVTYSNRALSIVPIKTRKRWIENRSHSQTLVIIGRKNDAKEFEEWGTAILSAKGYTTQRLSDAIRDWQRHTREIREKLAPGVPSWYFWQSVGTYGEYREEMVGKTVKNSITPIVSYLPKIDEKILERLYVGNDLAKRISELEHQAYEWATDKKWISGKQDDVEEVAPQHRPMTDAELRQVFSNDPDEEDGIPF